MSRDERRSMMISLQAMYDKKKVYITTKTDAQRNKRTKRRRRHTSTQAHSQGESRRRMTKNEASVRVLRRRGKPTSSSSSRYHHVRLVAFALASLMMMMTPSVCAVVPSRDGLPHLDDATFERETQASSGQTTGTWLVLFTNGESGGARGTTASAKRRLADAKDYLLDLGVVAASVDVSESPETMDRFRLVVKRTPSVVLLKAGKAYVRALDDKEEEAFSVEAFATSTYAERGEEFDIPPELTFIQKKFARATSGIAFGIVRLYAKSEKLVRVLAEDYAQIAAGWQYSGFQGARRAVSLAVSKNADSYGLLCFIIAGVLIFTAALLAVATFPSGHPSDAAGRARKSKTE